MIVESLKIDGTTIQFYDDYIKEVDAKIILKTIESIIASTINKSEQL